MMRWSLVTIVVLALVLLIFLGRQAEVPAWLAAALAVAFLAGMALGWRRRRAA